MKCQACAGLLLVAVLSAPQVDAQELRPPTETGAAAGGAAASAPVGQTWIRPTQFDLQPTPTPPPGARLSPARTLLRDFRVAFGTKANLQLLGGIGVMALASTRFDALTTGEAREHMPARRFTAGNIGGGVVVQTGLAAGTWAAGHLFHSPRTLAVGTDLIEAQLVTQTVVQGLKYTVRRPRPDGSNNLSFPSGHTATSFATATVLERHFGWAVGVPAYAFATYVGAARLAADKHHLSDVMMGAGIGLVAGRSATVGVAGHRFAVGVAPTDSRGAMVTFTRQ